MNKEDPCIWQAEDYHQNSHIQREAAHEVLNCIDTTRFKRVLDIGCGDGKITIEIANQLQKGGTILGIDFSSEMIGFAKKKYELNNGNIEFLIEDARNIKYKDEFDLIFSSFAIQWISDQKSLFLKIHDALKKGGCLAVTIPLGMSNSLEHVIKNAICSEKWREYFKDFVQMWHFYSADQIREAICEQRFKILKIETVLQETWFESRDKFEKYVLQWFPYLKPLPLELRSYFFHEIIENYIFLEPIRKDGAVRFCFSRVDIIANKINL